MLCEKDIERLAEISRSLNNFSSEIRNCFDCSEWTQLHTVLKTRQAYLEKILTEPCDEMYYQAVCNILNDMMVQDSESLGKIEEHKNKLLQLHGLLEHGRRAVKAYGGRW